MVMVFFSSDPAEVERVRKHLTVAGIANEVRPGVAVKGVYPAVPEQEVWVKADQDCSRAFAVCVQCHAGFAKRKPGAFETDPWGDLATA